MGRVEDASEEARGILAEDLQLETFGGALDQVGELIALLAQQVGELDQLEVEVDDWIVFLHDAVLDLPGDVLDDDALPVGALFQEKLAARLADRLANVVPLTQHIGQRVEMGAQQLEQLLPPFDPAVARGQMVPNGVEGLLVQLRRVVVPAAVDQVVSLIHHQHAVTVVALLLVGLEPHVRIENVVVVADDDVGLLDQLERDFEGTDLSRLRHLERDVRVEVAHGVHHLRE